VGRIACDCSITRHVFDSESVLVELGRQKRVVSPQLRKALEGRDRHCRWPGCTRPGSWCEAHHVVPWTRGGPTNPDNLVLLCSRHHVQVHEGRWQMLVHPDGASR
jgi:5-methylcytosine-specific restriction endonuclease McrA